MCCSTNGSTDVGTNVVGTSRDGDAGSCVWAMRENSYKSRHVDGANQRQWVVLDITDSPLQRMDVVFF